MTDTKVIVTSGAEAGLPYSKGLNASALMVTGLSPLKAYQVAEQVEDRLHDDRVTAVSQEELDDVTAAVLLDVVGERYATNFRRWKGISSLNVPLAVLIGGATGVGKSTIATQLAVRLGIVRVVATDAVREVMRAMLTSELMPTLYASSFEADSALREPPPRTADKVIVGFREQAAAVAVGIRALLERAALEGNSVLIEGAHAVPGFFELEAYAGRMLVVPVVVTVEDEDVHRSHFVVRSVDASTRPFERYQRGFSNIRKVQKYIKSQALSHGVPVIRNYSLDQALSAVIDIVVERVTDHLADETAREASIPAVEQLEVTR